MVKRKRTRNVREAANDRAGAPRLSLKSMGNRSIGHTVVDKKQLKNSEEHREEGGKALGEEASPHGHPDKSNEPLIPDSVDKPEKKQDGMIVESESPPGDDSERRSSREPSEEHAEEREEIRLSLMLCCDDSAEKKTLRLPSGLPNNVEGLKNAIQSELSIPVPCQKIYFETALLLDHDSPRYWRIRDGDVLHVHFNSEGDVAGIKGEIELLQKVIMHVELIQPDLADQNTVYRSDIDAHIKGMRPQERIRALAYTYFSPILSEESKANVACFAHYNGIDLLSRLHALVLKHPWERTPFTLQFIEWAILCVWWKLSAMLGARMYLLDSQICSCLVQSALRVAVKPSERVHAPEHVLRETHYFNQNTLLRKVIFEAVGTLCNLAEIPSCGIQLASNHNLMQQFTAVILSPTYAYHSQLVTTAGLVCLAYSPETHQHLAHVNIINNVMDACKPRVDINRPNTLLLRYFSALILAQLVTTSLSLIPDEYIHKIFLFLKYFLRRADHVVLHAEENINSFFWFTLLPHMTLAYCPLLPAYDLTKQLTTSHPRVVVRDLRLCCIELGIVSLQNMLQGERHQKVLIEEGLVDFVTCMPWHLPERTVAHARACQLTASLKPILRQPPSLLNIARAKLATTCFGLDCIMKKTVRELLVMT